MSQVSGPWADGSVDPEEVLGRFAASIGLDSSWAARLFYICVSGCSRTTVSSVLKTPLPYQARPPELQQDHSL